MIIGCYLFFGSLRPIGRIYIKTATRLEALIGIHDYHLNESSTDVCISSEQKALPCQQSATANVGNEVREERSVRYQGGK